MNENSNFYLIFSSLSNLLIYLGAHLFLELDEDPLAGEVFQAGREAIEFLGQRLNAYDLFVGLQSGEWLAASCIRPKR